MLYCRFLAASFILDLQDATYNPTLDHNKNEPGEMYVEDNELPRFVSQEECDRWNEEVFEEDQKRRDYLETISIKEKHRGGIFYNLKNAMGNLRTTQRTDEVT